MGGRAGYTSALGGRVCGASRPGGGTVVETAFGTTVAARAAREQSEDRRRGGVACARLSGRRDLGVRARFPRERNRPRSEEHTSELQSPCNLVFRLLLVKK